MKPIIWTEDFRFTKENIKELINNKDLGFTCYEIIVKIPQSEDEEKGKYVQFVIEWDPNKEKTEYIAYAELGNGKAYFNEDSFLLPQRDPEEHMPLNDTIIKSFVNNYDFDLMIEKMNEKKEECLKKLPQMNKWWDTCIKHISNIKNANIIIDNNHHQTVKERKA